ncbi:MAG: heavy-metal-associated domain-containing protein [Humibacillus sp.]|nr:heavy-metal-associated domain-containing protein [Humibacillus sp.]MDN5777937.1 heavy-metal-associated domain-containing protein [Humibacillus sp.]
MSEQSTHSYSVVGMTCDHCTNAVTSELSALVGVRTVAVDLATEGASTVTVVSDAPLPEPDVVTALDDAGGYTLAHG